MYHILQAEQAFECNMINIINITLDIKGFPQKTSKKHKWITYFFFIYIEKHEKQCLNQMLQEKSVWFITEKQFVVTCSTHPANNYQEKIVGIWLSLSCVPFCKYKKRHVYPRYTWQTLPDPTLHLRNAIPICIWVYIHTKNTYT